jgi:3-hydroxyisobutyrate dehydrogenase-like beta-hydroxyacid dehydrogenase
MKENIGFIGLGQLGFPLACNLLDAGYSLKVYNRTLGKAVPLADRGAQVVARPADAVPAGGIVMTILWDDASVESIVMSDSFLDRLKPGGIHVSMSTISPEMSKKLAAVHAQYGSAYIEAPIFGRPEAAVDRQLSVPYAGPQAAKERVRPLLEAMGGAHLFDFGEEAGAATIVKLIGNFLISSAVRSMKEALSMAEKCGAEPMAVVDMLTQTLFSAPIYKSYGRMIAEKKDGQFSQSKIPGKDLGLFIKTAQAVESPAPISSLLHEMLLKQD